MKSTQIRKGISLFAFLVITVLCFSGPLFAQENVSWRTRIYFQTPSGYIESDTVKEVSIIVNLPQTQGLKYVDIKVGTTEGGEDLYSKEIIVVEATPEPPVYVDENGFLVIPIGQYQISAAAFFIETTLYNQEHQPLQ